MRTVCLAIVPLITALLGYVLSLRFAESREFWDKFDFWHKKIKNEIAFTQNTLPEILASNGEKDVFLLKAQEFLSCGVCSEIKYLSSEENEFLVKYLQNLGTTDKTSQLDFLNSVEADILQYSSNADNKHKKYRPLYIKLGFLFGLIIFILLV